jgi:hypothetical protein
VGYASSGFGVIARYKGAELRKILGDLGVKCESSHFDMKELRENLAGRIEWAKDVGLTQMLVPSLGGPRNPTMDDVKRAAEEYNKMGEQSAKAGIQQGLHNEGFELSAVDGKRTYDLLLELLDPKLVKFQFQVSTISRGYDAAEYFTRHPGLGEDLHRREDGRHPELLCGDEPGFNAGKRALSSQSKSLTRLPFHRTSCAETPLLFLG